LDAFLDGVDISARHDKAHPVRLPSHLLALCFRLEQIDLEETGQEGHSTLQLRWLLVSMGKEEATAQISTIRESRDFDAIDESQLERFSVFI
jgi:hypothetical protein